MVRSAASLPMETTGGGPQGMERSEIGESLLWPPRDGERSKIRWPQPIDDKRAAMFRAQAEREARENAQSPRQLLPPDLREEILECLKEGDFKGANKCAPSAFHVLGLIEQELSSPVREQSGRAFSSRRPFVAEFWETVLDWNSAWRAEHKRRRPTRDELVAAFGDDGPIVEALWPLLWNAGAKYKDDRDAFDFSALAALSLQAHELAKDPTVVDPIVERALPRATVTELAEAQAIVVEWLSARNDRFDYVPTDNASDLVNYVRTAIRRRAWDAVPVQIRLPHLGDPIRLPDSADPSPIENELRRRSQRTRRRLQKKIPPDAESNNALAFAVLEAEDRQRHRASSGLTISEAAPRLGRPRRTVTDVVRRLEKIHGRAPREGRYLRLNRKWMKLLAAELVKISRKERS